MAALYQCDPPPKSTPKVLSSFYSNIPGAVEQLKKALVQALTLGVIKNMVELGLEPWIVPLADNVVAV
jgi:hypothetical protein